MALIYWIKLETGDHEVEGLDASRLYGTIDKKYLTDPYELGQFSFITASLMDVLEEGTFWSTSSKLSPYIRELNETPLTLWIVQYKLGNDRIYLSKDLWEKLRDLGVFSGSSLQLKITKATGPEGVEQEIYPRRDVAP